MSFKLTQQAKFKSQLNAPRGGGHMMEIISPIEMVPYPGWEFIVNNDGRFQHIPTHEWMTKLLKTMEDVTKYAVAVEADLCHYRNDKYEPSSDAPLCVREAAKILQIKI